MEEIEKAAERGELTELVLMVIRIQLDVAQCGMSSSEQPRCRTPFKDISNTTNNESEPTTSGVQPDATDPKERKRQREREVYANMPQDQKEKSLKKRRENYHRRKSQALVPNEEPEPIIPLTAEDDELLSENCLDSTNTTSAGDCDITTPSHNNSRTMILTNEQREAKRARERQHYASMSPEQREVRRARQNIQNDCRRGTQTQEHIGAANKRKRVAKRGNKRMERHRRRNTLIQIISPVLYHLMKIQLPRAIGLFQRQVDHLFTSREL
ncbi:unnamed protein product [Miscanthus lutarioriparius]|uniref:Uncharacterized protein n=1 Tax=Miscanthus lutarioriparius TaxID=422564 RepID=A0A811MHV2_9POAL|nr:unnamed protein product [Miscanthus lutarioriparius]